MNSVVLTGRLTRDPEVRYTASQMAVATFTLAVDRPYSKDKENTADFIRITSFGKQAEFAEKYLNKGRLIGVSGRIQTGSYQAQDGSTRYTTDVVADRIEFLGSGNRDNGGESFPREATAPRTFDNEAPKKDDRAPVGFTAIDDEDIPF